MHYETENGPRAAMPATGMGWKRALERVAGAALRLHRYRFLRTRILHDALGASRDGAKPGETGPGEIGP